MVGVRNPKRNPKRRFQLESLSPDATRGPDLARALSAASSPVGDKEGPWGGERTAPGRGGSTRAAEPREEVSAQQRRMRGDHAVLASGETGRTGLRLRDWRLFSLSLFLSVPEDVYLKE